MRFLKGAVVVGLAVSFCMAQTINLSGTVKSGGTAVSGATVWLLHGDHTTLVTSDASGNWSIPGGTAISNPISQAIVSASPVALSARGEIQLSLQEASQVTVKTYSVEGKQLGSMEKTLAAGNHSIMPAKANSGIYLYQVVVNGKAYTLQQANVNGRAYSLPQANAGTSIQGLAKSAAVTFPDSILCWKQGYDESGVSQSSATGSGIALTLAAGPVTCPQLTCGYNGTTDPAGSSYGGYYVNNNTWNTKYFAGGSIGTATQCLYMCNYHQWYVTAKMTNNGGEVQSYPCVQKIYQSPILISSMTMLKVDICSRSPHATNQIYNGAFDIWINGVASSGCTELMIWNDNWHQWNTFKPAQAHVTLDGREWIPHVDLTTLGYLMYEPAVSGTPIDQTVQPNLNVLEIMNHAISKGYMPATSQLYQVQYGWEICNTNSVNATFNLDDYVVHTY